MNRTGFGSTGQYSTPFSRTREIQGLDPQVLALIGDLLPARPALGAQLDSRASPELSEKRLKLPPFLNKPETAIKNELLYTSMSVLPLSINAVSTRVLQKPPDTSRRVYLFIIVTDPTRPMFFNFGADATALTLPLPLPFSFFEYNNAVPQDDVYVLGGGAATLGVLVYGNVGITKELDTEEGA